MLNQTLAQEENSEVIGHGYGHRRLAEALTAVAGRLEAKAAARLLNQALAHEKNGYARDQLAQGLVAVAESLSPIKVPASVQKQHGC